VIIEEGPAKIILPDGTEFEVILGKREITCDIAGRPVSYTFTPMPKEED
jgi:hypothetical protein